MDIKPRFDRSRAGWFDPVNLTKLFSQFANFQIFGVLGRSCPFEFENSRPHPACEHFFPINNVGWARFEKRREMRELRQHISVILLFRELNSALGCVISKIKRRFERAFFQSKAAGNSQKKFIIIRCVEPRIKSPCFFPGFSCPQDAQADAMAGNKRRLGGLCGKKMDEFSSGVN